MTEANSAARKRKRGGTGHFFIVDQRLWKAVCDVGDINVAVAYLVLLRGTGFNQRTTAWSVKSIMRYSHLGYVFAKVATDKLIALNFIRHAEKYKRTKPRYDLLTFPEWAALNSEQCNANGASGDQDEGYNLIWVPNQVIDGAANETTPIHKLRASGDLWALRLFIDLYHEHNLRDDGGISRKYLHQEYEAVSLGERASYSLMGFRTMDENTLTWSGPFLNQRQRPKPTPEARHPVWNSVDTLQQAGLLTFVPHLLENGTEHAQVIHAFGIGGPSEHPIETEIGDEARRAAAKMCLAWQREKAQREGLMLCPVNRDYPKAQLVGIGRLHYRAHTARTSAWTSKLLSDGRECVEHFRRLAAEYSMHNARLA